MGIWNRALLFIKQVKAEAKKIVWPPRREATISMVSVCVMVFFSSIILFLMDRVLEMLVWRIVVLLEAVFG